MWDRAECPAAHHLLSSTSLQRFNRRMRPHSAGRGGHPRADPYWAELSVRVLGRCRRAHCRRRVRRKPAERAARELRRLPHAPAARLCLSSPARAGAAPSTGRSCECDTSLYSPLRPALHRYKWQLQQCEAGARRFPERPAVFSRSAFRTPSSLSPALVAPGDQRVDVEVGGRAPAPGSAGFNHSGCAVNGPRGKRALPKGRRTRATAAISRPRARRWRRPSGCCGAAAAAAAPRPTAAGAGGCAGGRLAGQARWSATWRIRSAGQRLAGRQGPPCGVGGRQGRPTLYLSRCAAAWRASGWSPLPSAAVLLYHAVPMNTAVGTPAHWYAHL